MVFGAAFVFGTEAVVRLSSVFVAVAALPHRIGVVAADLWLGGPVEPVMILWVKSPSLARRPILQTERERDRYGCRQATEDTSGLQGNLVSMAQASFSAPRADKPSSLKKSGPSCKRNSRDTTDAERELTEI